jgi:hypothetical protein
LPLHKTTDCLQGQSVVLFVAGLGKLGNFARKTQPNRKKTAMELLPPLLDRLFVASEALRLFAKIMSIYGFASQCGHNDVSATW